MQLNNNIKKKQKQKRNINLVMMFFFNIHQQAILLQWLNNVLQSDLPKFCVAWIQQDNGNIA